METKVIELEKKVGDLEERLYELERLNEFIELHTGKKNVVMQISAMGEKIVDNFRFRGSSFGRSLAAPTGNTVSSLFADGRITRRNFLPLFHLIFGKEWPRFQQVNKWEGSDPFQVAQGKSQLLTTLLLFCEKEQEKDPIQTVDQLIGLIKLKWLQKRIQDMNNFKYWSYKDKSEIKVTLYTLDEIEMRVRDHVYGTSNTV